MISIEIQKNKQKQTNIVTPFLSSSQVGGAFTVLTPVLLCSKLKRLEKM